MKWQLDATGARSACWRALRWLAMAALVALLAGTASAFFLLALDWATRTRETHLWLVAVLPLAGFAVGWAYLKLGQRAVGGMHLLLEEAAEPRAPVPLRMAPMVLFGTVVSHLFGASVGREGTAVQMGGALADRVAGAFRLNAQDRGVMLLAGISAGFASVFGTPLAGAVFGMEVLVLGGMRYDALLPCLLAAVLADQVTTLWGAHHTHFAAVAVPSATVALLTAVVGAGIAFGLVARGFGWATHAVSEWMARRVRYAPLRPLLGGAVVAAALWGMGAWRYAGLGIPGILEALATPVPAWDFLGKLVFTVASLGSGFKGGEVTPLFYIGASLGNALSGPLGVPHGLLAALGLVAVLAGAANTPIACAVMAMELFGAPLGGLAALACSISYFFSGRRGIYRGQRPRVGEPRWSMLKPIPGARARPPKGCDSAP